MAMAAEKLTVEERKRDSLKRAAVIRGRTKADRQCGVGAAAVLEAEIEAREEAGEGRWRPSCE